VFGISLAGLTVAFAPPDARYAIDTGYWLLYVAVTVAAGLGLAAGLCLLLTRRLSRPTRRGVLVRFISSLAVIVALAASSDLGNAEYDEQGQLASVGVSPFMLLTWIAGAAIAVWLMRRVPGAPSPVTPTV
jgi:beta-lactamase regulating signal transducer with metallopeptidase domain